MDRKTIEAFEKAHHYILPESYINFLLICDNHPEKYCKGYRDIILYSLEELPAERKLYEMDEFCPEYIAIGYGGGGEVLIMKQERDTNTLIVSSGGALLWESKLDDGYSAQACRVRGRSCDCVEYQKGF